LRYTANGTYRKQYITKANDTFDKIAFYLYGDETAASYLINENPDYADVLVFGEGVKLTLPKLELIETSTLPKWKGGA
jgi:phage tail protein X